MEAALVILLLVIGAVFGSLITVAFMHDRLVRFAYAGLRTHRAGFDETETQTGDVK